jgi:hypothetical protein
VLHITKYRSNCVTIDQIIVWLQITAAHCNPDEIPSTETRNQFPPADDILAKQFRVESLHIVGGSHPAGSSRPPQSNRFQALV